MASFILNASRVLIIAMLLGGLIVTLGQIVGIVFGSGDLVLTFGSMVGPVSAIAGLAGIIAFLRLYTREGREDTKTSNIDLDEAGA